MRTYTILLLSLIIFACKFRTSEDKVVSSGSENNPQFIINKAIEAHGAKRFEALNLAFDFRDKHYTALRNEGLYTYTRSFKDSTGLVQDVLTNNGFTRTVNGQVQDLPADRVKAFSASVNSVLYFALLPFGLNDPTVQKEFLGKVIIKQTPYYKIKITFSQEGGGTDFQDEFLYYINQKSWTMDYLAYTFVTDGGGVRFRQAINQRRINGILFQDYINYEPVKNIDFWQIETAFNAGQLKELSRIELNNISVKRF